MKRFRPITPSRRLYTVADFSDLTKNKAPEKSLLRPLHKSGGRNHNGHVTDINSGGRHKRMYRLIDFKRDKLNIPSVVTAIEYDPNRTARIALLTYADGEKRYILAPQGLVVGAKVVASDTADITPGNVLPLGNIPVGEAIHSIELKPGQGAVVGRSAGTSIQLIAKEGEHAMLRMPSGEIRRALLTCRAAIGTVSNADHFNLEIGKAGRSRWLGVRPHNRGISKNPVDHPMGGRTNGGRHPCSRTAVLAKGYKTRSNKRTDKYIVRRRQNKKQA